METIKVNVLDMCDKLNAEGKYCIKVCGEELESGKHKEIFLDVSDLTIDQIGVIAGFLDAVFDTASIDKFTGASIVKSEDIKVRIEDENNNC